ncbi:GntR family transcriptional regulator / MocR family aminotransferase [Streptomyces sp. AmelKG-E11A]|nr:GntR family transcriptional regulator / MocR family aminotransferase [Streptomyces sp. AmelKG-E11A]
MGAGMDTRTGAGRARRPRTAADDGERTGDDPTTARAGLGIDLHVDPAGPGGLRKGLMNALREAVRGGRLPPGTRLPSSRTLAVDLGIARNTVADAYADLVAEGWLTSRQGSGTRVAERAVPLPEPPARGRREPGAPVYSLRPGTPDLSAFPRAEWLKAARRALTDAPDEALGYDDPRGRRELRQALAEYLARARGVRADPERIVVCSGFAQGLLVLGRTLRRLGVRDVAVESYGLDFHRGLLRDSGLGAPALPWGARGSDTEALELLAPGAVLLTPGHQFPMGVPLHPERRSAAVDWARRTGGLIVEDDYDGEFRYDRQPVGALQDLDPERVVYLGTASKSLAPGLRLGWMVLPRRLVPEIMRDKGPGWGCGALDQLTLAEFITSGAYDRHIRLMRTRYRRRRDQLVAALAERAPQVRATGIAAGLHAVLELPSGTEQSVIRAANWQGLSVHGLAEFTRPDAILTERRDALVVGYAAPSESAWPGTLDALCRALP